jgi:lysophospholipase L1-like esterase
VLGQAAQADLSTDARHNHWLPGWLRAVFFLPAAPRPMAHPDPHHVAESARHMARPLRKSPLAWLGSADGGAAGGGSGSTGSANGAAGGAGSALWTALTRNGRRFLPREPRRREVVAVLTLLVVASLFSVTGPIAGAGSMAPSPSGGIAAADMTSDPTAMATGTAEPSATASPDLTTPAPSPTSSPKPKPKAPAKKATPKPVVVRTFVALGDSLTAWPDTPWPTRLDAEDPALRLVHNAGVPGNTTAQMRARLTSDVYDYKPNVLFVLGGTNDLGLGISGSATIANLRAIIVGAKAHKITVIMLLVPPDSYTSMAARIDSLNAAIINLANSQKVVYVDIHAPLTNGNGVYYPKYTSDGLHFSDLGAQTVANTIRARIKRLGL